MRFSWTSSREAEPLAKRFGASTAAMEESGVGVMVQLPEPLDPAKKEQKASAKFCSVLGKPLTIAEITKERLRRAGAKVKAESPLFEGDAGFRVFKLASSNIRAWEPDAANLEKSLLKNAEHLVRGRKEQDVLYELLLKLGLDLCVPIETKTIAGKRSIP